MDALVIAMPGGALFAGSTEHGVYTSRDTGKTWQQANSGLPPSANIDTLFWEPIHQTLYASIDGRGLFATTNGGQSWTTRGSGLPARTFALIVSSEGGSVATATTLYAGTEKGLYASTDGGALWSETGTGLPAGRVLSLATDPLHADWLYAGTDTTVYRSQDAGRSWNLLASGLNHQVAAILAVAASNRQTVVFAGAGQLQRFPPDASIASGPLNSILTLLFLAALVAASLYTYRRRRQQIMALDQHLRATLPSHTATHRPRQTLQGDSAPMGENGDRSPRPPAPSTGSAPSQQRTDSAADGESTDGKSGSGRG